MSIVYRRKQDRKPPRHARGIVPVVTKPVPPDHTMPLGAVPVRRVPEGLAVMMAGYPTAGQRMLTETQPFPAPRRVRQPRFVPAPQPPSPRRVRPYIPGAPSLSREAVLWSERPVIANSLRRFTLPCDFCHREHGNTQADTFASLRSSATGAGWQAEVIYGPLEGDKRLVRWRCPRCVQVNPAAPRSLRSNPANLPVLAREAQAPAQLAERTAAAGRRRRANRRPVAGKAAAA